MLTTILLLLFAVAVLAPFGVDLTVTASQVLLSTGNAIDGTAGATITAGAALYYDASAGTWKLAQADGTAAEAGSGGLGIALNGASSGQKVDVAGPGCEVTLGAGAAPAASMVYVASATAGSLAPHADITTTGHYRAVMAVGSGSNKVLVIATYPKAAIP